MSPAPAKKTQGGYWRQSLNCRALFQRGDRKTAPLKKTKSGALPRENGSIRNG